MCGQIAKNLNKLKHVPQDIDCEQQKKKPTMRSLMNTQNILCRHGKNGDKLQFGLKSAAALRVKQDETQVVTF